MQQQVETQLKDTSDSTLHVVQPRTKQVQRGKGLLDVSNIDPSEQQMSPSPPLPSQSVQIGLELQPSALPTGVEKN